jgi:hypothetical protein
MSPPVASRGVTALSVARNEEDMVFRVAVVIRRVSIALSPMFGYFKVIPFQADYPAPGDSSENCSIAVNVVPYPVAAVRTVACRCG